MTENVSDEKIVISAEPAHAQTETTSPSTETTPTETDSTSAKTALINEKIVDRKTIVYETRVDPTVAKVAGEKLKTRLFTKFMFLKPKREDIQLVSISKYYEPYLLISGKYAIDYYRKSTYAFRLAKEVQEVVLLDHQLQPEKPKDPRAQSYNLIKLQGEERIASGLSASLILDQFGREIAVEKLPSAPSERDPEEVLKEFGVEEIAQDVDLCLMRAKILKRPKDIARIVNELFEINERAIIYTPRFIVSYKNTKTREEKAIEFDGVTAKRIRLHMKTAGIL